MSMHQGIDLSRFKKISSDGKTSTLRHAKGHEIKIAHGGLSPQMHDHLKNMPLHLAEGDEVRGMDPPVPTPSPTEDPLDAPSPAQSYNMKNPAAPTQTDEVQETPAPPQPQVQDPQMDPITVNPEKSTDQIAQEMNAHDLEFQRDLAKGAIHPKTYQDLYDNKSTLGKFGTLFGLLVGGAGAGLSHQPNALMEMMNKELERDYDAQKTSNSNTQNWYKASQAHQLQQSQIYNQLLQSELQSGRLKRSGIDTSASDAFKEKMMNDPDFSAVTRNKALNGMTSAAIQKTQDQVNAMPPGPARDSAQRALSTQVIPAATNAIATRNADSAKRNNPYFNMGAEEEGLNNGQSDELTGIGYRPGSIPTSLRGQILKERGDVTGNRRGYEAYVDAYNGLKALSNAGQAPGVAALTTGAATTLGEGLGGPLGAGAGAMAGNSLGHALQSTFEQERTAKIGALSKLTGISPQELESLLPKFNSTDDSAYQSGVKYFKNNDKENSQTLDTYGLKKPFQVIALPKAQKQSKKEDKKEKSDLPKGLQYSR